MEIINLTTEALAFQNRELNGTYPILDMKIASPI